MRSVEEQQSRVTAAAVAPRPVRVPIAEAQGLMCAEEVATEQPMPGFDQAAIDGYAVRSVDIAAALADFSRSGRDWQRSAIWLYEWGYIPSEPALRETALWILAQSEKALTRTAQAMKAMPSSDDLEAVEALVARMAWVVFIVDGSWSRCSSRTIQLERGRVPSAASAAKLR